MSEKYIALSYRKMSNLWIKSNGQNNKTVYMYRVDKKMQAYLLLLTEAPSASLCEISTELQEF